MGCATTNEQKFSAIIRLPRPLRFLSISSLLLALSQPLPLWAQEAGIIPLYYRIATKARPRLGTIMLSDEAKETGNNFRFCDGNMGRVDLQKLVPVHESCDEDRGQTYSVELDWNRPSSTNVYDGENNLIGKMTGRSKVQSGATYLITEFDWNAISPEFVEILEAAGASSASSLQIGIDDSSVNYAGGEADYYEIIIASPLALGNKSGDLATVGINGLGCQQVSIDYGHWNYSGAGLNFEGVPVCPDS